jgi:hypothetical protein
MLIIMKKYRLESAKNRGTRGRVHKRPRELSGVPSQWS